MKIIYLHQYFKTPAEGGGIRSYHIAKKMIENGHQVKVFSLHATKSGNYSIEGIDIEYLKSDYSNSLSNADRILVFIKYIFWVIFKLAITNDYQLIYATSTPITVGIPALIIHFFKSKKFYFEVRDLWPGIPIEMQVIKNSIIKFLLFKLENKIYSHAEKIIVLSAGMQENISKRFPTLASKTINIPNFSDLEFWQQAMPKKLNNRITIIYTGTLGKANNVTQLLNFIQKCNEIAPNQFLFKIIGDGKYQFLVKEAMLKYQNIFYQAFLNKQDLIKEFKNAHFSYISYADFELLHTGSPNKFYDSLATATPVIINFKGWIYDLLNKENVLLFHENHNEIALINNLISIGYEVYKYDEYSKKSIKLAQDFFNKNDLLTLLMEELNLSKQ